MKLYLLLGVFGVTLKYGNCTFIQLPGQRYITSSTTVKWLVFCSSRPHSKVMAVGDFPIQSFLTGDQALDHKVQEWFRLDKNEHTCNEIKELLTSKDQGKLSKILLSRLSFGTAGIRGRMGAGYAAMNDLVIIQTSQGLAQYMLKHDPECVKTGVVIGYDARHNSRRFAQRAATAFLQKDIPVYLFSQIVPTPFVPYAIRVLKASAGIVVTASHNPKDDNGYKVYLSNGAQICSPHDTGIQACILNNLEPWDRAWDLSLVNNCRDLLHTIKSGYYQVLADGVLEKEVVSKTNLRFTYTALHGVAHLYLTEAFDACGVKHYFPVQEQKDPDPDFPTVTFPNPEEGKGVLSLAFKTAESSGSNVIIANDPDADRCAVAEKQHDGKFRVFNGNEVAALLGWWLWYKHRSRRPDVPPADCYMLFSTVSSRILNSMAQKEGFNFIETLTGFKWMGNKADALIKDGKTVVFAFEEAIGYMCGPQILDKDGISAGIEVAQLAAHLEVEGLTLSEKLKEIYKEYGYHYTIASYFLCYDQDVIAKIFNRLSNYGASHAYPASIGSHKITRVRDLRRAYDSATEDHVPKLPCSSSSFMLTFYLENGCHITIRTSGTEPKIKYYSEIVLTPTDVNWSGAEKVLKDVIDTMVSEFLEPEKNGLLPPPN